LVGVKFDESGVEFLFFNYLIKIVPEIVSYDVQILLLSLLGDERVLHEQDAGVFKHFQDLMLPVLVFLVLENFLYRDLLKGLLVCPVIYYAESPFASCPLYLILGRLTAYHLLFLELIVGRV
jgi:hypothetical protein